MTHDVMIVGGGIVGLAAAFRWLEERPQSRLLLLEKESKLAAHQTGNNSGGCTRASITSPARPRPD